MRFLNQATLLRRALLLTKNGTNHVKRPMALTALDKKFGIVDTFTPQNARLSGKYKKSGGYKVMVDYLPTTLSYIANHIIEHKPRTVAALGKESGKEIIMIVGLIIELKYNLTNDKPLELFTGNAPDKDLWNNAIKNLKKDEGSYYRGSWLFMECYMYRKIVSFFEASKHLKEHDQFFEQKKSALLASRSYIKQIAKVMKKAKRSAKWFSTLLQLNLWSNRCDLTLTDGKDIQLTGNALDKIRQWKNQLLVNQTKDVWEVLEKASCKCDNVIVDILCDNSGYELFNDLLLASYMIDFELAHTIRFTVKNFPWFISDVTLRDFCWAVDYLKNFKCKDVSAFGKKLDKYMKEGKFIIHKPHIFWTSPFEFNKMKKLNPELYDQLSEATLIVVKGDLNHRKLIGDYNRVFTEPFKCRLKDFQPSNIVALRSIKSEVISGLNRKTLKKLNKKDPYWMNNGRFGVIQFAAKEDC